MDINRFNDMLERYGEVCTQVQAGKILSVVPRTIARMLDEGRLRRIGKRVDVRSICEYLDNPHATNLTARAKNSTTRSTISEGAFFAAARAGKWHQQKKEG